jgi:hypothetical protein
MTPAPRLRPVLKRAALVAAANWQVIAVQFTAETSFQVLLAVPVLGGGLLVGAAATGDLAALAEGDLGPVVAATLDALTAKPAALAAFLGAFLLVLIGGSIVMFLVKGGTVAVLAEAERHAGPIERPPLRLSSVARAAWFDIERFLDGASRLARRYLVLGFLLLGAYGLSGAAYLAVVVPAYRAPAEQGAMLGWTVVAALTTVAFLVWITAVNFAYRLVQMIVAADDCSVAIAAIRAAAFVRRSAYEVAGIFGVIFALFLLATTASIVAAGALGLIAFVPIVGLIAVPIQVAAWLLRGVLFQYLGLTALGAYLVQYRVGRGRGGLAPANPSAFPEGRIA